MLVSADVAAGNWCETTVHNCSEGQYCSGLRNALRMTKCCPLDTTFDFTKDVCVGTCQDKDKDGFGVNCDAGTDCDDTDAGKNAGKQGSCSLSNNRLIPIISESVHSVNGTVDNSVPGSSLLTPLKKVVCVIGECQNGDANCDGTKDAICTAKQEVCRNGLDDDGDGLLDDGCCGTKKICSACGDGWGYCDRTECEGLGLCSFVDGVAWFNSCDLRCEPDHKVKEVCNNFDDDLDGKIDNGVCIKKTGQGKSVTTTLVSAFLTYPLETTDNNYVISGWFRSGGGYHSGIDYVPTKAANATEFYLVAAADGEIMKQHFYTTYSNLLSNYSSLSACISADGTAAYGNRLMIKHNNSYISIYGHIEQGSFLVKPGDNVTRGQRLAKMGNTGCSTGRHLHFEIRKSDQTTKVDPYDIYGVPTLYPDVLTTTAKCGSNSLWTSCPPALATSKLSNDITNDFIERLKEGARDIEEYSSINDLGIGSWMVPHFVTKSRIHEKLRNVPMDKINLLSDSVLTEMEERPFTFKYFSQIMASGQKYDFKNSIYGDYKTTGVVITGRKYDYDITGNLGYGYIGSAAGFSPEVLKMMAGLYQIEMNTNSSVWSWEESYFDDPQDQKEIERGIVLWQNFEEDINPLSLREVLSS